MDLYNNNQIDLPYSNIYKQTKEEEILCHIHIVMKSNLGLNSNENK